MIGLDPYFIARNFGELLGFVKPTYEKPHPECDNGCMYVCTEGFSKPPVCNEEKNT
jgi:hypothetical protein